MKKLLYTCILLAAVVAVAVFALPTEANAATEGYYTYTVSDGKATITAVDTSISGDVTIPSTLGGCPVTAIDVGAFSSCSSLTGVTIPDSVTRIGSSAFSGCSNLEHITIPFVGDSKKTSWNTYQYPLGYIFGTSSYTGSVGVEQYYYGSSTWSTTSSIYYIPASLKSVTVTGGEILCGAFDNCSMLTDVILQEGVTSIGSCAFYECSSLTGITIPGSVTSIGTEAFRGCSSLTGITIPDSVTSIGSSAFYNCSSLTGITIPGSVTSIGEYAFYECSSLTGVTIPDSVTSIGSGAFCSCSSLTGITIPEGVTSIGRSAFEFCSSLTSITIPEGVTSIGDYAFYGCNSLTSITIPDSVTSIGSYAFCDCSRLTSVAIPEGVTSIGDYAFFGCSRLTSVTIPEGVTSIGDYAFYNCSSLTSITIPGSVTSIGSGAFKFCSSLKTVYYSGNENQWQQIKIGSDNTSLTNATIHYNHIHDYSLLPPVVVPATCEEDGYTEYTCVYGERYRRDYVDAVGHKMVLAPAVAATCTEPGLTAGTKCERCSMVDIAQSVIPALGHNYVDDLCTNCGEEKGKGDFNGDGNVTDADAIYLLRYTLFPEDYPLPGDGDVNGDGSVTDADAIYLLRYTLFGEEYPLYPKKKEV